MVRFAFSRQYFQTDQTLLNTRHAPVNCSLIGQSACLFSGIPFKDVIIRQDGQTTALRAYLWLFLVTAVITSLFWAGSKSSPGQHSYHVAGEEQLRYFQIKRWALVLNGADVVTRIWIGLLSQLKRTAPEFVCNRAEITSFRRSRRDCFGVVPSTFAVFTYAYERTEPREKTHQVPKQTLMCKSTRWHHSHVFEWTAEQSSSF